MQDRFAHINAETLYSIFNHRMRAKCAISGKRLQDEKVSSSLYHAFKSRVKENHANKLRKAVIPELATERGFFPWMAFRTILIKFLEEREGQPPTKKKIQSFVRSPHLLRDDAVFLGGRDFCTKFDPLNDFFKRRASYRSKE